MSEIRQTQIMEATFNKQTKSVNTINELENETVNGNVFYVDALFTTNTGDIVRFGAVTPDDMDIRLYPPSYQSDANYMLLEIYADATFTGTTELTPVNANGQSAIVSDVTVFSEFDGVPSIIGATKIGTFATLGGIDVGQNSAGGIADSKKFLVLKRDTKYLFVNTNVDGDNVTTLAKETWIETDLTD